MGSKTRVFDPINPGFWPDFALKTLFFAQKKLEIPQERDPRYEKVFFCLLTAFRTVGSPTRYIKRFKNQKKTKTVCSVLLHSRIRF